MKKTIRTYIEQLRHEKLGSKKGKWLKEHQVFNFEINLKR